MEAKKTIGIYITPNGAIVSLQGRAEKDSFLVEAQNQTSLADSAESAGQLAEQIASQLLQRSIELGKTDCSLTVNSAFFLQHKIDSEFSDVKQIAQTVRFDTEEALATDIGDLAIAFKVASVSQSGSNLSVWTCQRKLLNNILDNLNRRDIDPVFIEPDIICLSRFLQKTIEKKSGRTLFAILSQAAGYIIIPQREGGKQSIFRTFLVGSIKDRLSLLKSQIAVTGAQLWADEKIETVAVFDSAGSIDAGKLSEAVGIKAEAIDLAGNLQSQVQQSAPPERDGLRHSIDPVELAIARGAALAFDDKQVVDFRADFKPYQGKQIRRAKNLKIISLCAIVCIAALGIFFQIQLAKVNSPRKEMRRLFNEDYRLIMSKPAPGNLVEAKKELEGERRRLIDITKRGSGGSQSLSDKLAILLTAFNSCAKAVSLEIDNINLTLNSIRITGKTATTDGTLKLRDSIEKNNFKIDSETITQTAGKSQFIMNLSLSKGAQ